MSDQELFYDDLTEKYLLENLRWRFPVDGCTYKYVDHRFLKLLNPDEYPVGMVPVVREICGKCGGYGGEQLNDGWFSCYRCCEVGYEYTPLDMFLMDQLHLDALEENYMFDLERLPMNTGDPSMILSVEEAIDRYGLPEEVENDIPF